MLSADTRLRVTGLERQHDAMTLRNSQTLHDSSNPNHFPIR